MNREQRRRQSGCSKHKGKSGKTMVICWSCPACFDEVFGDAPWADRELTEQEINTGMRAALVCLTCARDKEKEGWELVHFPESEPHNRWMLFCPHEEEINGDYDDDLENL